MISSSVLNKALFLPAAAGVVFTPSMLESTSWIMMVPLTSGKLELVTFFVQYPPNIGRRDPNANEDSRIPARIFPTVFLVQNDLACRGCSRTKYLLV